MTMHLLGPAYSTISSKKRKSKGVTIDAKVATDFREHNKQRKRLGLKERTVDEYIAYRQGKLKYQPKIIEEPLYAKSHIRQSPKIPSYGDQVGSVAARTENKYTGTLITGIATMHKSNAVPVINKKQAEEISRMRR